MSSVAPTATPIVISARKCRHRTGNTPCQCSAFNPSKWQKNICKCTHSDKEHPFDEEQAKKEIRMLQEQKDREDKAKENSQMLKEKRAKEEEESKKRLEEEKKQKEADRIRKEKARKEVCTHCEKGIVTKTVTKDKLPCAQCSGFGTYKPIGGFSKSCDKCGGSGILLNVTVTETEKCTFCENGIIYHYDESSSS
eukprot:TRINITY_DN1658_c0_g2_i1.p1 TRINITY_DN1658_c0_g2~~TRINITY_DN1658_c0_g2_i1.p1  ORF type:complete len:202 (+),score=47.60 TRINITY_DN1658_c0_g2_i1:23-607(+)